MADRATASQRLYLRALLNERELPTHTVTVMHRDIFRRAGIQWVDGMPMDHLLDSLSQSDVSRLADELRDDEEEDE